MEKEISLKDKKALIDAARTTSLQKVKELVELGVNPNEVVERKGTERKPMCEKNAYCAALTAQRGKIWGAARSNNYAEQKAQLKVVEYLTPLIKSTIPDETKKEKTYLYHVFSGLQGEASGNVMYDDLIRTMINNGYNIKNDPTIYHCMAACTLPLVKEIVSICGTDDGDSVFFTANRGNLEVLNYLLDMKTSVNKPFVYSSGRKTYPLFYAVTIFPQNIELFQRFIAAGVCTEALDEIKELFSDEMNGERINRRGKHPEMLAYIDGLSS